MSAEISATGNGSSLSNVVIHLDSLSRVYPKIRSCWSHRSLKLAKHTNGEQLPDLQYPDIYIYLPNTFTHDTKEAMKAYKNLDGYKYFWAGWVHRMQNWNVPEKEGAGDVESKYQPTLISNVGL